MSAERGADVVVVGGGVIGCAVTYFLTREGLSVTLLERDRLHAHASGAAAGMLAPLVEFDPDGPLMHFGARSLAGFPDLCAELLERSGVDPQFVPCGILRVARDDAAAARLQQRAARLAHCDLEWIDAHAARRAEAQLASDVRGALFSPREAHVLSPRLTDAYARAATQLGARVETGVPVLGLVCEGERVIGVRTAHDTRAAACVVLCAGAWTQACAGWLPGDVALPIEPVRGQIVSLDAPRPSFHSILWDDDAYLVPKRDGSIVVGATVERVGFDARVTAEGVRTLLSAAVRLAPALDRVGFRGAFAGLRPATPDELPVIGPLPGVEGVLVAAGHHRNGVLLSPATGELIAALVLGKDLPEEAAPLRPDRFRADR